MLRLDQIDILELGRLLDQREDPSGYLDPETGELYPVFEGEVIGFEDEFDGDEAVDAFLPVDGDGGHRVYRDMAVFAEWVGDHRIRRELSSALDGPRPMRTFRDVIYAAPERVREHFNAFSEIRSQLRALDFLAGRDLVAEQELEERRVQLVDAGDALLESISGGPRPRLILLNGLPGVGKSAIAKAYVADRPGALNLDIDVLRTLLGGAWEETAEPGRALALSIAETHLASGNDVVVPQLVADRQQLARFEAVAKDFEFVLVMVEGTSHFDGQPWQASVAPEQLQAYARGLERITRKQPGIRHLHVVEGDPAETAARLRQLLGTE